MFVKTRSLEIGAFKLTLMFLFSTFFQVVVSELLCKLLKYLNVYMIVAMDFAVSSIPIFILFQIGKKLFRTSEDETDRILKKGALMLLFPLLVIFFSLYYGIFLLFANLTAGLFTRTFEEKIIFWHFSENVDLAVILISYGLYIFLQRKNEKFKGFLGIFIMSAIGIFFLVEAVNNALDLRVYYTKGKEALYEPCVVESLIKEKYVRGGVDFYVKCKGKKKEGISSIFLYSFFCKTKENSLNFDFNCQKKEIEGKEVFLIKSLYSDTIYGLRLAEEL
ncbi:hypothetical protein [Phorcysia thermohydrogeniphila]|uniref:Uncharacterized protein n=1 Tax=Phorcysia thermohydrogeniphila TaxID=936138 RepID=A0A4R1GFR0_9BACT|nr:hypothetical protein [Phorcysia thermohydrogeniphila]TCK04689.1 hypothetical protein CLV27_1122 [Phorcysia thermohydrogeniphila]